MRICVTGGTGFTGAALVIRLLELGHDVVSLDKNPGIMAGELEAKGAKLVTVTATAAMMSKPS